MILFVEVFSANQIKSSLQVMHQPVDQENRIKAVMTSTVRSCIFRHIVGCSDLCMFPDRTSTYKSLAPGRSEEFEGTDDGEEANEQAEEEELENDEEVENSDEETGPAAGFNMTGYGRGNAEEQEEGSESFESSGNEEDPGDEQLQGEDEGFEEASAFEAGDASPAADIEQDVDQVGYRPKICPGNTSAPFFCTAASSVKTRKYSRHAPRLTCHLTRMLFASWYFWEASAGLHMVLRQAPCAGFCRPPRLSRSITRSGRSPR